MSNLLIITGIIKLSLSESFGGFNIFQPERKEKKLVRAKNNRINLFLILIPLLLILF